MKTKTQGLVVIVLVASMASAPLPAVSEETKHFEHPMCAFNFDYPSDWTAEVGPPPCTAVVTQDPSRLSEGEYRFEPIEIRKIDGTFVAVADEFGFDWRDGEWFLYGRQSMREPAVTFKLSRGYHGLRGTVGTVCRRDDEFEGEKYGCWFTTVAFVAPNGDAAGFQSENEDVLDVILKSFSFDR